MLNLDFLDKNDNEEFGRSIAMKCQFDHGCTLTFIVNSNDDIEKAMHELTLMNYKEAIKWGNYNAKKVIVIEKSFWQAVKTKLWCLLYPGCGNTNVVVKENK